MANEGIGRNVQASLLQSLARCKNECVLNSRPEPAIDYFYNRDNLNLY